MSTEIKNTLFRFVTMRAPELSEEDDIKSRFVFRDARVEETEVRIFEDAMDERPTGETKWSVMVGCAKDFRPNEIDEFKEMNKKLYSFAIWIAKNKFSYSHDELVRRLSTLTPAILSIEKKNVLWDNLFYQVVTKKDFYAKEVIMQLLVANHILVNFDLIEESQELAKQVVNAKVVLPKNLFVEDDSTTDGAIMRMGLQEGDSSTTITPSSPSEMMIMQTESFAAKTNIDSVLQLKKELKKAEKKFNKEYQEAYKLALESHAAFVNPILEQYEADLKTAKEDWCGIRNPDSPYDPKDPCQQPVSITKPKLPALDFTFRNEMDMDFLQDELSTESFVTLLDLLEIDYEPEENSSRLVVTAELPNDGLTYSQTHTLLDDTITQNAQMTVHNAPSQNTTVVSVGGVVVPTTTPVPSDFSFEVCPDRRLTNCYFSVKIQVPDGSWDVAVNDSKYQILGGTTGKQNLVFANRIGNSILLKTSVPNLYTDSATATEFHADIIFTNGTYKTISVPTSSGSSIFKSCFRGMLSETEESSQNTNSSAATNFIPSGFGFKQIGIADYKKVEQTVQGYVEGDVAHIENIMAREYREKATRKLRRNENTTTSSSESEKEKLSDTTSTDRFEMQSEVAKVIQQDNDMAAQAGTTYKPKTGNLTLSANVNIGSHSSNEVSTREAINQAKEITERALERIVTKVKEERIEKIIEEYEENNKHGFDNTKGDKHVVGVYRWVDKVYKNQVVNYGKRLMFEFMIPQPSKLHILGMTENNSGGKILEEPIDPRKYVDQIGLPSNQQLNLKDYSCINENTLKYWAGKYNVDLKAIEFNKVITDSYSVKESTGRLSDSSNKNIAVPEGYKVTEVKGNFTYYHCGDTDSSSIDMATYLNQQVKMSVCGKVYRLRNTLSPIPKDNSQNNFFEFSIPNLSIQDNVSLTATTWDIGAFAFNLELKCEMTSTLKQEIFKAIIDAYEIALADYNQKLLEENQLGVKIKGENPGFYRQIENMILRKNCISYIIDQNPSARRTYGKNMFTALGANTPRTFGNHEVKVGSELDDYAAFSKFMEQAFEWEIMSYDFYPYYWGDRKDWSQLYQYDNNDPLFRNFMQAGMARVVVTARPGFEEAVRYYMQTGEIWNGGEVPVIEDELFMSIVDELHQTEGKKEGKAWATRLPTSLTILQAQTIGLNVTKALPFDEDLTDFENPEDVPQTAGLDFSDAQLGITQSGRIVGRITGNQNIEAKIVLKKQDVVKNLTYCDASGNWELNDVPSGEYELLLDVNDDFPSSTYQVAVGSKNQTVTIAGDQVLEINLTLEPLNL